MDRGLVWRRADRDPGHPHLDSADLHGSVGSKAGSDVSGRSAPTASAATAAHDREDCEGSARRADQQDGGADGDPEDGQHRQGRSAGDLFEQRSWR